MRSIPFSPVSNSSSVCQIDDGPRSSFEGRSSSTSSFHASLLQAIDGVKTLDLFEQVVSRAPQHLTSYETQAAGDGCFAR